MNQEKDNVMRKEVLEFKEKVDQHFNKEMKLVDEIERLDLTEEEDDFLLKAQLEHPLAKRTEKKFNINMRQWVEKLVQSGNK